MPLKSKLPDIPNFSTLLIEWYEQHKRELPWRNTSNPYVVWMSEIILQQTRVQQGLPYFERFLSAFPTIDDFAVADEQAVLKLWQGLGYYSRARNMLACAQQIMEEHNGKFPNSYQQLLKLKGIGKYTAAAIASLSFREVVPVVDGNVYRVLARLFGLEADIADAKSFKLFFDQAGELISQDRPDLFNQAIMEFGALQCVPKSPNCQACVFNNHCFAFKNHLQHALPVKLKRIKKRLRYFNYFIVTYEDQVLIRQRESSDIWQGMYEFMLEESAKTADILELFNRHTNLFKEKGRLLSCSETFKHVLTHQTIFARFINFEAVDEQAFEYISQSKKLEKVSWKKLDKLPVSRLIDKYLKIRIEGLA